MIGPGRSVTMKGVRQFRRDIDNSKVLGPPEHIAVEALSTTGSAFEPHRRKRVFSTATGPSRPPRPPTSSIHALRSIGEELIG